jgi:signal transduction histidine kinase
MLALPVSMAMAVLRYRLWGVEPIVRRALVYSTWTLSVAAIYGFVVGALSLLFRTTGNALIALVATGVSAILFQPLRDRLQRAIGRLLYGERDAPYVAMARLGQRLEDTLTPETVLPTLVETIAQALRLPYVAIALQQDDVLVLAASYPSDPTTQPEAAGEAFNLTHQGAMIGQLQVQLRAPEEPLTEQDRRLLADLARQASAALHGLRLQRELQRTINELGQSRERLVLAREEERRRLRRDLHDGIGPTLASLVQRIDRVRVLIPNDPTGADAALVELKAIARTAVADIRGLVYALRPPVLDELGLVGALRQHAESYAFGPLAVRIDAPEPPLALSAAVEVASYRIVLEALTNVARHAQANTCQVRIVLEPHAHGGVLELEILDDGIGIPADRTIGVGLTAIAERVAELGGTLMIGQNQPCGTRVYAWLPVSAVRHDQAEPSFDHG